MKTATMKNEIAIIEAAMPESGIASCYGKSQSGMAGYASVRNHVAALRFCGMPVSAQTFECNACGESHLFREAVPVNWRGSACLVGESCITEEMECLG